MAKCPYCGKKLVQDEMYCWHCEQDVTDSTSYQNKPKKPLKIMEKLKSIKEYVKKFKKK